MGKYYLYFMEKAFGQAELVYKEEEVPIGVLVVLDSKIIGKGYNSGLLLFHTKRG